MTHVDGPIVFTAQSKRYFYCREAVCEFVFARDAIPLNPFMVFGYFVSDRVDRDAVRDANDELVRRSDQLWVFGQDLANGVLHEIALAASSRKTIRFFTINDRPDRIQELHVDALRFEEEVRARTGHGRERLLQDLRATLLYAIPQDRSLALDI